jgi:hypothetical protein
MKLSIPEEEIELYETGFDKTDFLDRKPFADKLSGLIDKFETPFVVALDGPWGSGKSFFLKRWVGHHQASFQDTVVVYLDAFELDYLDEPMVALVSEISARFELQLPKSQKIWQAGKKIAAKLLPSMARIAANIATAGISDLLAPAFEKGVEAAVTEIDSAATKLWEREHSRREAVTEFRKFLESLTKGVDDLPAKKIVVVIDELDRCRPDYALSMLEIIKHFFDVNNVHFILGVNLAELENMARARYGEKLDARNYIGKFIKVNLQIPETRPDNKIDFGWEVFFDQTAKRMGFDGSFKREIKAQLKMLRSETITLRTIQRLLTAAAVVPDLTTMNPDGHYRKLFCSLFLFNFLQGKNIASNQITLSDMQNIFNLKYIKDPVNENQRNLSHLYSVLAYTLNAPEFEKISDDDQRIIKNYFDINGKPDVAQLLRDYVLFATAKP